MSNKLLPKTRVWHNDVNNPLDLTTGLILLAEKYLNKDLRGVEIGSFSGASTEVFAHYTKEVHAIDPWETMLEESKYAEIPVQKLIDARIEFENLMRKHDNIHQLVMKSEQALSHFHNKSLDYVYIDGAHDHDNATFDIVSWKRKLKPGGLLMGHDCGLVLHIVSFLKMEVLDIFEDSSWVVRID